MRNHAFRVRRNLGNDDILIEKHLKTLKESIFEYANQHELGNPTPIPKFAYLTLLNVDEFEKGFSHDFGYTTLREIVNTRLSKFIPC